MIELTVLLTRPDKKICEDCLCICHPTNDESENVRQCKCLEKRMEKLEKMRRALVESQMRHCPKNCTCKCDHDALVGVEKCSGGCDEHCPTNSHASESSDAISRRPTELSQMKNLLEENVENATSSHTSGESENTQDNKSNDGMIRRISNVLRLSKKN